MLVSCTDIKWVAWRLKATGFVSGNAYKSRTSLFMYVRTAYIRSRKYKGQTTPVNYIRYRIYTIWYGNFCIRHRDQICCGRLKTRG